MDGAILVVSAADGPMPQTREHILLARQVRWAEAAGAPASRAGRRWAYGGDPRVSDDAAGRRPARSSAV